MRKLTLGLAVLAGCASYTAPADLPAAKKPDAAPAMAAKPAPPAAAPKPAAPIDTTPIKVDLSKVKWGEGPAELFGHDDGESRLFYYANGTAEFAVKVPADGEYAIVVTASSQPAQNQHAKFKVTVDGQAVGAETSCTAEEAKEYAIAAKLAAGDRKVAVVFTNDIYKQDEYDRNFYLNGLRLTRVK